MSASVKVASELMNWEELGFNGQPVIYENVGVSDLDKQRIARAGLRYKVHESTISGMWNYSNSLTSLKNKIRSEHAIKGKTPRFKWQDK